MSDEKDASKKLAQDQKSIPPHGFTLLKVYETLGKNATHVEVKVKGQDLVLKLDESNEEDICAHFDCERGTRKFANHVLSRVEIVKDPEGPEKDSLKLEFQWGKIKRIRIEEAARQAKIAAVREKNAATKAKKDAEIKARKEAETAKKAAEEKAKKEAELAEIRKEEEKKKADAKKKQNAFESIIMGAVKGGGVMMNKDEKAAELNAVAAEVATLKVSDSPFEKTWSPPHNAHYFMDKQTGAVTWRNPDFVAEGSPWEKIWDEGSSAFYFKNSSTNESRWDEPWLDEWSTEFSEEHQAQYFLNKKTQESVWIQPKW